MRGNSWRILALAALFSPLAVSGVRLPTAAGDDPGRPEFYFAQDGDNPDELEVVVYGDYTLNSGDIGQCGTDSGINALAAGAAAGINNSNVQIVLSATTSRVNYGTTRMSISGISQLTNNCLEDVNGSDSSGSFGIPTENSPMRYYGVIWSDVHPVGTPCTATGVISMLWAANVAGDGGAIIGNGGDISVEINGGAIGTYSTPGDADPLSGGPTVNFSATCHVGDRVLIKVKVANSIQAVADVNVSDSMSFAVTLDVGAP
jgi:hypothetical protein